MIEQIPGRKREISESKITGFSEKTRTKIKRILEESGLPLTTVRSVKLLSPYMMAILKLLTEGKKRAYKLLHQSSGARYNLVTSTIGIYHGVLSESKDESIPEWKFVTFIIHELAHANSPHRKWRKSNRELYGSKNAMDQNARIVRGIANQCLATDVFLNDYHTRLATQYRQGLLRRWQYYEETWAILVQLRYLEPERLRQVENSHREIHSTNQVEAPFVKLLGDTQTAEGIDRILLHLMRDTVRDTNELDAHITNYRNSFNLDGMKSASGKNSVHAGEI